MTEPQEREPVVHYHDFEAGEWGVIVGVSKCRKCGKVSERADFPNLDPEPQP